jgi:hypothetical protein
MKYLISKNLSKSKFGKLFVFYAFSTIEDKDTWQQLLFPVMQVSFIKLP